MITITDLAMAYLELLNAELHIRSSIRLREAVFEVDITEGNINNFLRSSIDERYAQPVPEFDTVSCCRLCSNPLLHPYLVRNQSVSLCIRQCANLKIVIFAVVLSFQRLWELLDINYLKMSCRTIHENLHDSHYFSGRKTKSSGAMRTSACIAISCA